MELCIVIFLYFFLQFSFKISSNVAFCELNTVYFPLVTRGVFDRGLLLLFFSKLSRKFTKWLQVIKTVPCDPLWKQV